MTIRYAGEYSMIAQVLPFDDRATIYYGQKDGYYSYSENIKDLLNISNSTLQDSQGQVDSAISSGSISKLEDSQILNLCNQVNTLVQKYYSVSEENDGQAYNYGYAPTLGAAATTAQYTLQQTAIGIASQNNSYNSNLVNSFRIIAENQPDKSAAGIVLGNYYFIPGVSIQPLSVVNNSNQTPQATNPLYQVNTGSNSSAYVDKGTYTANLSFLNATVPGNMKMVRNYHYYDSFRNIVSNNIIASSENMWNRAVVLADLKCELIGYWLRPHVANGYAIFTATANDGIWEEKIREKIVNEPNAVTTPVAWGYALGHLGRGMNEMYSGNLTVLGDSTIKPNDVVFINDYYTDMHGPFEVREVNHHFSHDTGFVTNIVPDLIVYTNNTVATGADALAGGYYDDIANVVLMGRNIKVSPVNKITNSTAFGLGNPSYSTPALSSSVGTPTVSSPGNTLTSGSPYDFYINRPPFNRSATVQDSLSKVLNGSILTNPNTGRDTNGGIEAIAALPQWLVGITPLPSTINDIVSAMQFACGGLTIGIREPINFIPLIYSNRPYIAGIEGWRRMDWWEATIAGMKRYAYYNIIKPLPYLQQMITKAINTGVTS